MSDVFTAAAEDFVNQSNQDSASQTENNTDSAPSVSAENEQSKDQAIFSLDKMDKFSFGGREWTRDTLSKLIDQEKQFQSMNKDYTQKTQTLSQERKSFEEDKKFRENLAWDLRAVEKDPNLAQVFLKTYPESYHKYLEAFLKNNAEQVPGSQQTTQKPQVDVQLLSRLDRLEKFHNDQEVARHETEINKTVDELSKKYPDAANFKELVLSRAYEARLAGNELTNEDWEKIFKEVDEQVGTLLKAKYGSLVKQQTEANSKAKDVGAGGGTAGRAPVKFKNFDQLQKHAEEISRGG